MLLIFLKLNGLEYQVKTCSVSPSNTRFSCMISRRDSWPKKCLYRSFHSKQPTMAFIRWINHTRMEQPPMCGNHMMWECQLVQLWQHSLYVDLVFCSQYLLLFNYLSMSMRTSSGQFASSDHPTSVLINVSIICLPLCNIWDLKLTKLHENQL